MNDGGGAHPQTALTVVVGRHDKECAGDLGFRQMQARFLN